MTFYDGKPFVNYFTSTNSKFYRLEFLLSYVISSELFYKIFLSHNNVIIITLGSEEPRLNSVELTCLCVCLYLFMSLYISLFLVVRDYFGNHSA